MPEKGCTRKKNIKLTSTYNGDKMYQKKTISRTFFELTHFVVMIFSLLWL